MRRGLTGFSLSVMLSLAACEGTLRGVGELDTDTRDRGPAADAATADVVVDQRLRNDLVTTNDGGPDDAASEDSAAVDAAAADGLATDGPAADVGSTDGAVIDAAAVDASASDSATQDAGGADQSFGPLKLVSAFPKMTFDRPVHVGHADDGTNRIFVVDATGVVWVFANDPQASKPSTPFLDLSSSTGNGVITITPSGGDERGLLGLAFHPDYKTNGYFFVNYTTPVGGSNVTRVMRYKVSANANVASPQNPKKILEIAQFAGNHNGGHLAFGPDGYLYIGLGDGGGGGDPAGNGQKLSTLLGAMLRIDIDAPAGTAYTIPSDNPLVGNVNGYREEIWAWGFRNPWRYSFDPPTGWLWVGDVGQSQWEEIDVVEKAKNYGWNVREGAHCYQPNCSTQGLVDPVHEYGRNLGASVSGGRVYRGPSAPSLTGLYIFGDFVSGRIFSVAYDGTSAAVSAQLFDTTLSISAFGIDQQNELLLCDLGGKIYKLTQL